MDVTPGFVCAECGESHDGWPMDRAYTLPDAVWAIPKDDRASKATFTSDLCEFGERRFYRCVLFVPIIGRDDSFGWGLWVEVDQDTFELFRDIYINDIADAPLQSGKLANHIPTYEDSIEEPVTIRFGPPNQRPTLWLSEHSETTLAREQRDGISESRYHAMLEAVGAI